MINTQVIYRLKVPWLLCKQNMKSLSLLADMTVYTEKYMFVQMQVSCAFSDCNKQKRFICGGARSKIKK